MVPAKHGWRAWWRNLRGEGPTWIPGFRPTVRWISGWDSARLPDGDALIATAWQTARTVVEAPDRCGRKLYFIQHYESLYHGDPGRVDATYALPLGEVIDLKAESARLQKEIKKLADEVGKIDAKLGNANFVARAPEEVVEEQRERRRQAEQTRLRLSAALERLG